jgi:hypothetical protein
MTRLISALIVVLVIACAASLLEARDYIVRPRDTLSNIAQAQLGSARRWKEIAALNNLRSPYSLKIGQLLTLPDDGVRPAEPNRPEELVFPVDPEFVVDTPTTEPGWSFRSFVPKNLFLWGFIGLLVLWAFSAMCLWIGCWFALVETTFLRCVWLALLHAGLLVLVLTMLGFMFGMLVNDEMSPIVWPVAVGVLVLIHLAVSAAITKRVLDCKWRSVLTIGVMANLTAELLAAGVMLILLAIFT